MSSSASLPAATRRDVLRDELLATVSLLKQRRAAEIAEGSLGQALKWIADGVVDQSRELFRQLDGLLAGEAPADRLQSDAP